MLYRCTTNSTHGKFLLCLVIPVVRNSIFIFGLVSPSNIIFHAAGTFTACHIYCGRQLSVPCCGAYPFDNTSILFLSTPMNQLIYFRCHWQSDFVCSEWIMLERVSIKCLLVHFASRISSDNNMGSLDSSGWVSAHCP